MISRARHEIALQRIAELTEELRSARACIERMTDNALFGAGVHPIFDPAASRFQVRSVEDQRADNAQSPRPLTAAEWRRRAELLDLEAAERDRKGRLAEDLRRLAAERRTASPAPPTTAAIALLLTLVCGVTPRHALAQSQSPQTNSPYAAGAAVASSFGGWSTSGAAIGQAGQDGSIAITAAGRVVVGGVVVYPFFVGNLITIDAGAQQENVTILSSNCSGTGEEDCNVVAFFTMAHNGNLPVSSATFGLREAIQAMKGSGGQVLITPAWGGVTSMISAAPGTANVQIVDSRSGDQVWYGWNGAAYAVTLDASSGGGGSGGTPCANGSSTLNIPCPAVIAPASNTVAALTVLPASGASLPTLDVESSSGASVMNVDAGGNTNVLNNLSVGGAVTTAAATAGFVHMYESPSNGTNYVGFQAPASLSVSTSWTPPTADGATDQSFCTNGASLLFFCGYHGHVSVASGTNPTASLPFPAAFASAPDCTATPQSDVGSGNRWAVTSNTSGATIAVFGTLGGSVVFNVTCGGH